eukprot:TRINITY_DN3651_c0_g1_i1.p1 TRINITY_DN3651_c0_g1~~TRINITY_DN3651_c0_g1_i1.p1  ORF type:complete len:444 (-),score=154.71 TRINITY_DN3651_c0_g1_i1:432-1763(-)
MWGWVKNLMGYDDFKEVQGAGDDAQEITTDEAQKQGLWQMLSGAFGKDITRGFSLPVWIFEPTSFLQVMSEPLQFDDLLFKAAEDEDSIERIAHVAAFAVATWSIAVRTRKPFNPLLGETFEMAPLDGRFQFIGEQVSHHPPIAASRTTSDSFILELESEVKTKFTGNSVEANPIGTNHFHSRKYKDHITWGYITSCAHNIFIGKLWIDHYGSLEVKNHATGDVCTLNFVQCGFWSGTQCEVNGEIRDNAGQLRAKLAGFWNDKLSLTRIDATGKALGESRVIWQKPTDDTSAHPYRYNKFIIERMNGINEVLEKILPDTDSRLRGDRRALEAGDQAKAGEEKHRLEEEQRARRKTREETGTPHVTKYFKNVDEPTSITGKHWVYKGGYWEQRREKVSQLEEDERAKLAEVAAVELKVEGTVDEGMAEEEAAPSATASGDSAE